MRFVIAALLLLATMLALNSPTTASASPEERPIIVVRGPVTVPVVGYTAPLPYPPAYPVAGLGFVPLPVVPGPVATAAFYTSLAYQAQYNPAAAMALQYLTNPARVTCYPAC